MKQIIVWELITISLDKKYFFILSKYEIQGTSFRWRVSNLHFHSVKHAGFRAKENVLARNFTAIFIQKKS